MTRINPNGVLILAHLSAGLTLSHIPSVLGGVHAAFKPGWRFKSLQVELLSCRKCPSKLQLSIQNHLGGVDVQQFGNGTGILKSITS